MTEPLITEDGQEQSVTLSEESRLFVHIQLTENDFI